MDSHLEAARKAAGGNWRKPRMKMYDYNQDFGGNYYQPMLHYIYEKEAEGPFHERRDVHMPERAEVTSDKYTSMRYADRSPVDLDLDNFLTKAYKKQIRDVNSSTAYVQFEMLRDSRGNTLLLPHAPASETLGHYLRELRGCADRRRPPLPQPLPYPLRYCFWPYPDYPCPYLY